MEPIEQPTETASWQTPQIDEYGLGWKFSWPTHKLEVTVDAIRDSGSKTTGTLNVYYMHLAGPALLATDAVTLTSTASRQAFVKSLVDLDPDNNKTTVKKKWTCLINQACSRAEQMYHRSEPAVRLTHTTMKALPWRVSPLVYEGQPAVLFAPGGSGKSYLALLIAMLTQTGGYLGASNLCAVQGHTLYLDWEADKQALDVRWSLLTTARPEFATTEPPLYRRLYRPLADELRDIQRVIKDYDIKLVVIDSLAPAAGGSPNEPDTALHYNEALRALGVTSISLAHCAKNSDSGQTKSIFGSAFFTNMARSVWELQPVEDDEFSTVKHVTLFHRKVNDGKRQRPMSFRIDFQHASGGVHIEPIGADDLPSQEATQNNSDKIRAALSEGPKNTEELELATGLPAHTIRSRCSDGQKKNWCMKLEGRWHLINVHL